MQSLNAKRKHKRYGTSRGPEAEPFTVKEKDALIGSEGCAHVASAYQKAKVGGSFLVTVVSREDGNVITMKRSKASKGGRPYPITVTGDRAELAFHEKAHAVNEVMRSNHACALSGWHPDLGTDHPRYPTYKKILAELEKQNVRYYGDEHVRNGLRTLNKKPITRTIVMDGDEFVVDRSELKPAPMSSRGQALSRIDLRTGKSYPARSKVARAFK